MCDPLETALDKNKHHHNRPDDKEQSRLFIEKARELGADEDQSAADELIGQLAKRPPEPRVKKRQDD